MKLNPILSAVAVDPVLAQALEEKVNRDIAIPRGMVAPTLALMDSALTVAVTPTGREAEELAGALRAYMPASSVEVFPAWETLPHERLSPRADTVARRLRAQRRLAHPEEFDAMRVLVMPVRALLQPVTVGLGELKPVRVRVGDTVDLEDLERRLVDAAYSRVDMVERRGEFAVRGGIIDIFPPADTRAVRVELFGDEVEEIRTFAVADQRSLEAVDEVYAPACREILLTDDVRARARMLMDELPGAADMLEKISAGIAVEGMESLAPALVDMTPVIDTFPEGTRLVMVEPERLSQRADSLLATTAEFLAAAWSSAASGGKIPVDVDTASFQDFQSVREDAFSRGLGWWTLAGFAKHEDVCVDGGEPTKFLGKVEDAIADIGQKTKDGWRVVLVVEGGGIGHRMVEQLQDAEVPAVFEDDLTELQVGVCRVTAAPITAGFTMPGQKLAVYAASDVTGRGGSSTRDMRKMPARRKNAVDPLVLKPGDYIVHDHHGVGRFVKMEKRAIGPNRETLREYLVVEYASTKRAAPPDQLWIPTDALDQVSRYSGGEAPTLNKMGGSDWAKTKQKARAATRQIAQELIRLYAARQATKGFAFSADTPWQRELEDSFAYVETPDQLQTIDEVKADMEKPVPMDRLISGDVGYGKTEIAVRAAFKAVQDGKQVAILVPTTLLVSQHFETFQERFSGFPVRLAELSRFQTAKESEETIEGLRAGKIDVVIGTHRLLTGSVRFKNLGLVVVDEEQRFGVEHKETLKQLYPEVDVLSMSATPIPRTLEMAVTGVREMSTLATPPEERHPVLTYVGAREDKQITAAIRRELLRDGQVFYVHNRTGDMERVASHLGELVPEARIGVAHGKMSESQLERVIQAFWNKEIDVLVCTTIVETGLDISNANTLIVEDAQRLGLSQLHQLRGRVGRGRERAYAYFLYNPDKAMTETALERLRTIAAHTDLGAGIQVAMRDLEIRGAGNMLGGEQSGHIAGVGFDLYVRMVAEAVAKLRGADAHDDEDEDDVRIELPIDAYLPENYVPSERLRLEIYSKVAGAADEEQREAVRSEMLDRYGPIPAQAERLFRISQLRELCREAGIREVGLMGRNVRLAPVEISDSRQARLKRLYPTAMLKPAVRVALVRVPGTSKRMGEGSTLEGDELIDWVSLLIHSVFLASVGS